MLFLSTALRPRLHFIKPNLNGAGFKIKSSDRSISSIKIYSELKIMPSQILDPGFAFIREILYQILGHVLFKVV